MPGGAAGPPVQGMEQVCSWVQQEHDCVAPHGRPAQLECQDLQGSCPPSTCGAASIPPPLCRRASSGRTLRTQRPHHSISEPPTRFSPTWPPHWPSQSSEEASCTAQVGAQLAGKSEHQTASCVGGALGKWAVSGAIRFQLRWLRASWQARRLPCGAVKPAHSLTSPCPQWTRKHARCL